MYVTKYLAHHCRPHSFDFFSETVPALRYRFAAPYQLGEFFCDSGEAVVRNDFIGDVLLVTPDQHRPELAHVFLEFLWSHGQNPVFVPGLVVVPAFQALGALLGVLGRFCLGVLFVGFDMFLEFLGIHVHLAAFSLESE